MLRCSIYVLADAEHWKSQWDATENSKGAHCPHDANKDYENDKYSNTRHDRNA
tara:strand:+ start:127 stop:285 length:159 start_codon:yes stop_codon:yes gene_type:complete